MSLMTAPMGRARDLSEKIAAIHWPLALLAALIAGVGCALLVSAAGGSFGPWGSRHALRFALAFVGFLIAAMIPPRVWFALAVPIWAGTVAALGLVSLLGVVGMGARRWIDLGFLRLQPSEFAKIAVILVLARLFHRLAPEKMNNPLALVLPLAAVAIPALLIIRQPDLGTTLLLLFGAACAFFLAGIGWKWLAAGFGLAVAAVPLGWLFLHDYQRRRVLTFLDPEREPLGAGYHITQSKIAFGSGGLTGRGFLEGTQGRLDFLPEKRTDFIFSILGEEFGLAGTLTLLGMYCVLALMGFMVAASARGRFSGVLAGALSAGVLIHALVNMAMVMGLAPVVGAPLPLVSYGGSSMLATMWSLGLVMSVHVHQQHESARAQDAL